jgi:DNA-binding beta-propeller fold protein YncE
MSFDYPLYKRWLNYWDVGDICSGPLKQINNTSQKINCAGVEDRELYVMKDRNCGTTEYVHALSSLDPGAWSENGVPKDEGDAFKCKVAGDILYACGMKPQFKLNHTISTNYGNGPLRGIAVSPDDQYLYVASWGDTYSDPIATYRLSDYRELNPYNFGRCHANVAVTSDEQRLFTTSDYQNTATQINLSTGTTTDLSTSSSWPQMVGISPDGKRLVAVVGCDGRSYDMNNDGLAIYDISNGGFKFLKFVSLNDEPSGTMKIAFSKDSQYVYLGTLRRKSSTARLYQVNLNTPYTVNYKEFSGPSIERLENPALLNDKLYICDPNSNKIRVLDTNTWIEQLPSFTLSSAPRSLQVHPNGSYIFALLPTERAVIAIDPNSGSVVRRYDGLDNDPQDIEFNSDGTKMYISHSSVGGSRIFEFKISWK